MKKNIFKKSVFILLAISLLGACSSHASHTHIWSKYYDNGDGTHTRRCLNDVSHTETGKHIYSLDSIIDEATDVTPGKERHRCELCGASEIVVIPPKGNYVFDQKIVDSKYLYERLSDHNAIYYMSSKEGAFGNPQYLFEYSDIPSAYTEVDYITSNGTQFIDTNTTNTSSYSISSNHSNLSNRLPSIYQAVDYIEATGQQYIDLDVIPNGMFTIEMTFETTKKSQGALWCARGTSGLDSSHTFFVHLSSKENSSRFQYNKEQKDIAKIHTEERNTIKVSRGSTYLNNSLIYTYPSFEFVAGNKLKLFASYVNGISKGLGNYLYAKIYSLSINDENMNHLYSFIPCYEIASGTTGLYDSISNKFYKSNTNIDFLKGVDVEYVNNSLPSEYQEVEYIESTGTQYIDTEVIDTNNTAIEIKFSTNDKPSPYGTATGLNYTFSDAYPGGYFYYWDRANTKIGAPINELQDMYIIKQDQNRCYRNGEIVHTYDSLIFTDTQTMYLFGRNNKGQLDDSGSMKIYYAKIYDDGLLIRDYVPCYRKNDLVIGLYDVVHGVFYGNDGEGLFNKGEEIVHKTSQLPNGYQEVEYIQSGGLERINSGITVTNEDDLIMSARLEVLIEEEKVFFGANAYTQVTCPKNVPSQKLVNLDVHYNNLTSTYLVDNEVYSVESWGGPLAADRMIGIFQLGNENNTWWNDTTNKPGMKMKLYSFSITKNGTLVRDFVPCISKDNEAGLFDKIEERFYKNDGTGNFMIGPIKEGSSFEIHQEDFSNITRYDLPVGYHQLAYLRSYGNQTIETGIIGEARIELDATFTNVGKNQIMGYNEEEALIFGIDKTGKYMGTTKEVGSRDNIIIDYGSKEDNKAIVTINEETFPGIELTFPLEGKELKLFSLDGKSGCYMKCYSIKIYQGDVLVRHYIPTRLTYTNEVGLFDIISNKFYPTSSGTNFEGGSDFDLDINMENINVFVSRFSNEKILQKTTIRNYKIFDNDNNVIKEFVPVIRNSDGKAGLYEIKEQKFYMSPVGDEFIYGKKISHHLDNGVVIKEATYKEDGILEYTCSICHEKIHEKIDRTAYKVEFKTNDKVTDIKIYSEIDPSKYETSLLGYTRNINTYNYSKSNAYIMFEVVGDSTFDIKTTSGVIEHVEGNIYRITKILSDTVVVIE